MELGKVYWKVMGKGWPLQVPLRTFVIHEKKSKYNINWDLEEVDPVLRDDFEGSRFQ